MPSSSFSSRIKLCFRRFAASTLPPGNSHKPAIDLPGGTLRDEHAPVGIDEGAGGDKNEFGAHSLTSSTIGSRG